MKRTSDQKCCGTCVFGDFELTPKGNFRRDSSGHCTYDIKSVVLPTLPSNAEVKITNYMGIQPQDFPECPCYEKVT